MNNSRVSAALRHCATTLSLMLTIVCLAVPADAQQGRRTVDLRQQLVPIPEEQAAAGRFTTSGPGVKAPFPITLTVQSITPVSFVTGNALVELLIRNTSDTTYRLPVSREMKFLHAEGNEDRRMLLCTPTLTHDGLPGEVIAVGSMTFSFSGDASSVIEVRANETIVFRFEAAFNLPWKEDAAKWKDGITQGRVLAGVLCTQEKYVVSPDAARGERRYGGTLSDVRSENKVRLSIQP